MGEHTPGPWHWTQRGDDFPVVRDRVELPVAIASFGTSGQWTITPEECLANVQLISCAPELLAALQIARGYIYLTHCQLASAIGHEETTVRPDLDRIDTTLARALEQDTDVPGAREGSHFKQEMNTWTSQPSTVQQNPT